MTSLQTDRRAWLYMLPGDTCSRGITADDVRRLYPEGGEPIIAATVARAIVLKHGRAADSIWRHGYPQPDPAPLTLPGTPAHEHIAAALRILRDTGTTISDEELTRVRGHLAVAQVQTRPEPEPATVDPQPGTFPECFTCPEQSAGCVGNSNVHCEVPFRYGCGLASW